MRRLHTLVPLGVARNSGSRVRLPTMTTLLMDPATVDSLSSSCRYDFSRLVP